MENIWLHGNLTEIHFSQILSRIWQSEGSGRLEITSKKQMKRVDFFEGQVALVNDTLDKKLLLQILSDKKLLSGSSLKKIDEIINDNNRSLIRALHEENLIPPTCLWEGLADYSKTSLYPVFDWTEAEFFFDPEKSIHKHEILMRIPIPDLILKGIRQMTNEALIRSFSPDEKKAVQILSPHMISQMNLEPPEEYLLLLLESQKTIKNILAMSELGKKETRKIILIFISLGVVGFPEKKKTGHTSQEISKSEMYGIMEAFNEKCSYIFKYISKEIGPVALNILEKCLEDTKPLLSPILSKASLGQDGKIEANSVIKGGIALSGEEIKAQLLPGLNEILVALVLAVKRTLGKEHEAALVKNLRKLGEWN